MTNVILLVLVVVLWIVVLAPSALRRMAERKGVGSIDHFHHQLQLLEHAGPKLVAPAYRLHTAVPGGAVMGGGAPAAPEVVADRPKLFLLRPVDDERAADIDGDDGSHYERVGVLEAPQPLRCPAPSRTELAAERRLQARHRTTVFLRLLVTATITTGILGMLPVARLAWIGTGIFGAAALGLLGLIGYAREVEIQQRRGRPSGFRPMDHVETIHDDEPLRAAEAGYPGAWDEVDEYDEFEDEFGYEDGTAYEGTGPRYAAAR